MGKLFRWKHPPHPGQDFQDWTNMLADGNGHFNKGLFSLVLSLPTGSGEWNVNTDKGQEKLRILVDRTGLDYNQILCDFKSSASLYSEKQYDIGQKKLEHKHARVCPQCIEENPYIVGYWRYTPNTHCTRHKRLLSDTCPSCSGLLSWHAKYRFCCKCQADKKVPIVFPKLDKNATELPAYLNMPRLDLLIYIIDRISRPLDSLPGSSALSSLDNATVDFLFRTAYSYYHSAKFRQYFDEECIKRRTLLFKCQGKSKLYHQKWDSSFTSINNSGDSHGSQTKGSIKAIIDKLIEMSCDDKTLCDFVTPKRYKKNINVDDEYLIAQVDTDQIAEYLAIDKTDVRKLIDNNLLTQPAGYRTTRDMLFDVRTIDLSYPSIPIQSIKSYLSWRALVDSRYLDWFRSTLSDVICALHTSDLIAYSSKNPANIGDVFFDKTALLQYLDSRVMDNSSDISIAALSKFYCVDNEDIYALVQGGYLYTNHWQSTSDIALIDVKFHSFHEFHQKYISLNREARLSNRRITALTKQITQEGITIDIQHGISAFVKHSNRTEKKLTKLRNEKVTKTNP